MISKKQAKQLTKLLDEWTRCEIIARLGDMPGMCWGDYAFEKLEREHDIRKLLYGTANLVKLGLDWGLIQPRRKRKKKKKRSTKKKSHLR